MPRTKRPHFYVIFVLIAMVVNACSPSTPAPSPQVNPSAAPDFNEAVETQATQAEPTEIATEEPPTQSAPVPVAPESALVDFLRYVPDTESYREWLAYGDAAAWYQAWDIARPDSVEALTALDPEQKPYILQILPVQTIPPSSLHTEYLLSEDQRSLFGFDLLDLDRYLEAGFSPNSVTVVESRADAQQVASALSALGYQSQGQAEGTLFSIREDNEIDVASPTRTNRLANLNRIFLSDQRMIIGSSTDVVQNALQAYAGQISSLADDAHYVAVALSMETDTLDDMGELVGLILMDGSQFDWNLTNIPDSYTQNPLPAFDVAAFGTLQKGQSAYLVLALVFPPGTDAQSAADVLAQRMRDYTSTRTGEKLDDRWSFEKAAGLEVNDLPVALVVMCAEASQPQEISPGSGIYGVTIWRWTDMIANRDLLFLVSE